MTDEMTAQVQPGVYRHYKGKNYFVLGLSKDSETGDICVVYRPLYDSDWPQLWHRPVAMFCENVIIDGVQMPRFERIAD